MATELEPCSRLYMHAALRLIKLCPAAAQHAPENPWKRGLLLEEAGPQAQLGEIVQAERSEGLPANIPFSP